MTAVAEVKKTAEEIEQERLMAYKPPFIKANEEVLWYRDCDPSRQPFPARVTKVGNRCHELQAFDPAGFFRLVDGVRFKDDPSLEVNQNHRDSGCWDYTDQHKQLIALQQRVVECEELIVELGKRIDDLTHNTGRNNTDYNNAIGKLQQDANKLKSLETRVDLLEQTNPAPKK